MVTRQDLKQLVDEHRSEDEIIEYLKQEGVIDEDVKKILTDLNSYAN